jgi:CRP/FNR family transcriptional regulator, cyclic AMP receptor protein
VAGADRTIEDVLVATTVIGVAGPDTIAELARASRWRTVQRNEMLFAVGEQAGAIFVVASGTLRVFTSSANGSEPTLALLHDGEVVGELGVLDDLPRSASIAALRRSEVVEVPARAFRAAYASDPAISQRMVTLLADRLRRVTDGLADLAYLDLGGRLAKYILSESERSGRQSFVLSLTQAEMGQLLGGARQTINQAARSLHDAGLVGLDGRTVTIIDEAGLRLRAMSAGGRFD